MSNATLFSRKQSFLIGARLFAALAIAAASVSAQATNNPIIFDQGTQNLSGLADASQNDTTGGFGNFATAYDDFTLAQNSRITDVHWTGEFFNPSTENSVINFTIQFWNDNAGQPGAVFGTFAGLGNPKTPAGPCPVGNGGFITCKYDVDLPGAGLAVLGGTRYWMSIVPDLEFPPQWGWSESATGNGISYQDFFGDRITNQSDLTFQLTGTANGPTVPEPATLALLGMGLAGLGFSRRRKKA